MIPQKPEPLADYTLGVLQRNVDFRCDRQDEFNTEGLRGLDNTIISLIKQAERLGIKDQAVQISKGEVRYSHLPRPSSFQEAQQKRVAA